MKAHPHNQILKALTLVGAFFIPKKGGESHADTNPKRTGNAFRLCDCDRPRQQAAARIWRGHKRLLRTVMWMTTAKLLT